MNGWCNGTRDRKRPDVPGRRSLLPCFSVVGAIDRNASLILLTAVSTDYTADVSFIRVPAEEEGKRNGLKAHGTYHVLCGRG